MQQRHQNDTTNQHNAPMKQNITMNQQNNDNKTIMEH